MLVVYKNGVVDLDKVLADVGEIKLYEADYSECSRVLYPDIDDSNCHKLRLMTSKPRFLSPGSFIVIHEGTEDEVEVAKKAILSSLEAGVDKVDVTTLFKTYKEFKEESNKSLGTEQVHLDLMNELEVVISPIIKKYMEEKGLSLSEIVYYSSRQAEEIALRTARHIRDSI